MTQPTAIHLVAALTVFSTPCFEDVLFGAAEPVSLPDIAVLVWVGDGLYGVMVWGVVLGSGGNAKVEYECRWRVGECSGVV